MPIRSPRQLLLNAKYLTVLRTLLAQHVPQAEVWAFGSRVNGSAHEGSDIDLVLRNPQNLGIGIKGGADLQEALQESALPMLVEVHDWAHLPEDFHRNIEQRYVVVQKGRVP